MTEGQIDVEHLSATTAAVVLRGEHDVYTVPTLRERLDELHAKQLFVIIDLSQTAFLDSSVLGAMLGATEKARGQGTGVAVVLGDPPTDAGRAHLRGHGPRGRAADPRDPRRGARDTSRGGRRSERRRHARRAPPHAGPARRGRRRAAGADRGVRGARARRHVRRATCASRSARRARTSSHTPTATATSLASSRLPCCSTRAS